MGLVSETIIVKVTGNLINYYEKLGYCIPTKRASDSYKKRWGKDIVYDVPCFISVEVKDLPPSSAVKIRCKCDYCNKEKDVKYCDYYNSINGIINKYACKKCNIQKVQESNLLIYGVKAPAQLDDVKEKMRNTTNKRYGADYYMQTNQGKRRVASTNMKKYGSICPLNNEIIKKKALLSTEEKYGVTNPFQSEDIKLHIKELFLDKYGVENPMQVEEIKLKNRTSYKNNHINDDPLHSDVANQKRRNTFYENQTIPTSTQQRYLANLYAMDLNYPLIFWNVDMFDKDNNIYLEFDGGGHQLCVKYKNLSQEKFNQKETERFYSLKQHGYKMIRIISLTDKLPSDEILFQMLQDAKQYFSDYPNHSWIKFDIDNGIIRNAEHQEGIPYFYGELRKITKEDLEST